MFQRRCEPTFITLAVIEARFTVTQSVSACTTHFTTIIMMFFLILQCIILSRYIFVRFAFCADTDVVVTYILADFDRLCVCFAVVSAVCCIMVSYILRKRADEKDAKDAVLQKKIANWRKVRRRQLRSNADNNDMFDACGVTQDLRLSLEEDEQFCEKKHEIEELETQINLWNRIGDVFKHLLNSCVILVCLLAFSSFIAFAYSYVCRLWR